MLENQSTQNKVSKEENDSVYVHILENEVDMLCKEYIFMMSFETLKNVTYLYLKIGRIYRSCDSTKALNNYIKALNYVEYAVSESENDEIMSYYTEIVDYLQKYFKVFLNNDEDTYNRAAIVNRCIIENMEEETPLSEILSKNLKLGSCFQKRGNTTEACLVYKNAILAGRKLLTQFPWSANYEKLARGCFGYAKTVQEPNDRILYAKEALNIFDNLMRADYFQWEWYEGEKREVEVFISSISDMMV